MYTSFDDITLVKIITLLKSHKSEFLSGEDISDSLKLSRTAIWKHIKKIEALGYEIEIKSKLGYRLTKTTNLLLPWEILDGLKTRFIGKKIYYFDTINSTQDFAYSLVDNKDNGIIVVAQKQTHGRGRLKRKWESPKGGIWLSIILHPEFDIATATLFPLASSLALATTIEKTLKIKPELKWPNDVTIKNKKIAGMLVDADIEAEKINHLVLGIGINFNINTSQVEKKIEKTQNFYGVGTIIRNNKASPSKFVQKFLLELERIYEILDEQKYQYIIKEWTKRSSTIGKRIKISVSNGIIKGRAIRIDPDGALVISNKKEHRVLAGDLI